MREIALVLVFAVGCGSREPFQFVQLSGRIPETATPTGNSVRVAPGESLPTYAIPNSDCFYAAAGDWAIRMVIPPSDEYVTQCGISLDTTFREAKVRRTGNVIAMSGWGHVVHFSDGWSAVYCCGENCVDCEPEHDDTPKLLYIRPSEW